MHFNTTGFPTTIIITLQRLVCLHAAWQLYEGGLWKHVQLCY